MTTGAWRTISVAIRANTSGFSGPLLRASQQIKVFESSTNKSAGNIQSGWTKIGKAIGVGAAAVGVGFAVGIATAVKHSVEFEKRISAIGAVSGATGAQLDAMRSKALQLGADTVFSATDAASAMEELAKAGVSTKDILGGAADATVALAAAGEVALPEAARIAANAMNAFQLSAKQMPHIADEIAGAANASAIDVSEFGFALSQSAAVAHISGVSFSDLSVAIAEMGNAGIKGQDAGTSLKSMFLQLEPTTKRASTAMSDLGIITAKGANQFFTAEGKVKSLSQVQGVLQKALHGLTQQQQVSSLKMIFGTDAVRAAAIMAQNGAKGFDKLATAMGKVKAADVAKKRMDNLAGSIEQFRGSLDTLLIKSGGVFTKALRGIVDGATSVTNALADPPKGFFDPLVAAGHALRPIWDDLVATARNMWTVLVDLWRAAKPVVTTLAQIGAAAVVGGLTAMAQILASVTGLLARFSGLIKVAATALFAFGAVKVFSALASGALSFALMLERTAMSAKAAGGSMATAFKNVSVPQLAVAALAAEFVVLAQAVSKAHAQEKSRLDDLAKGVNQNRLGDLTDYVAALGKEADAQQQANDKNKSFGGIIKSTTQLLTPLKNTVLDTAVAANDSADAYNSAGERLKDLRKTYTDTLAILNAQPLNAPLKLDLNVEALDAWLNKLKIDPTEMAPKKIAEAIRDATDAAKNGTPATDTLAASFKTVADETSSASDQLKAFKSAMDAVIGVHISAFEATSKFSSAVFDLTKTLLGNTRSGLDANTEAGRKNRDALAGAASAALAHAQAVAEETGHIEDGNNVLKLNRQRIIDAGVAAGVNRMVMEDYANQLGLTPKNLTTLVKLEGKNKAATGLADLHRLLKGLPGTKKPVTARVDLDPSAALKAGLTVGQMVAELQHNNPKITAFLDDKQFVAKADDVARWVNQYNDSTPTAKALLKYGGAQLGFTKLSEWAAFYASLSPTAKADLDKKPADERFAALQLLAQAWQKRNPTTSGALNIDPARLGFTTLSGYATFYEALSPSTIADLKHKPADDAFAALHLLAIAWRREHLERTVRVKVKVDPLKLPFGSGPTKDPPKKPVLKPGTFSTFDQFFASGVSAGTGFEKGVDAKVKSWGKGGPGHKIAAEALFGLTDTLESHSPSRATARIGVDAALGFIVGLGSLTPVAAATAGATGLAVGAAFATSVAPAFTAATLSVTGTVLAGLGAMTGAAAATASATGLAVGAAFQSTVVPAFDVAMLTVSTGVLAGLGTLAAVGSAAASATGLAIGLAFATTVVPAFDQANQAVLASTQRMLDAHALLWQLGTFRVLTIVTQFGMAVVASVDSIYQPTTDAFQRTLDTMQVQAQVGGALIAGTLNSTLAAGVGAVAATMKVYGATLVGALNPILTGIGAKTITTIAQPFAFGGRVPGSGRGDKVPAMLEPDEVVIRNRSGDKFGRRNLLDLNEGKVPPGWKIPGMATGGLVQPASGPQRLAAGGAVTGLNPEFLRRFQAWTAALGNKFSIGSGWRSSAQQAVLYDRWIHHVPGQAKAAKPGTSMHEFGLAIDHVPPNHNATDAAMATVHKLYYPMSFEPWHIQPVGIGKSGAVAGGVAPDGTAGGGPSGPAPVQLPQPPDIKDHGHLGTTATLAARHTHDLAQTWADQHTALPAPTGGGSAGVSTNFTGPASGGLLGRVMAAVRQHESGGNYTIQNPYGSASGAYQVLSTTWNGYGGYPTAASAPPAVQDRFAAERMGPALAQYGIGGVAGLWFVGDPTRGHDPTPVGGPGNSGSVLDYTNYLTNLSAHIAGVPGYAEGGIVRPQRFVSGGRVGSRRGMADPNTRRTEPVAPIRQPWVDRPVHLLHGKALRDDQKRQAYAKFHPEAQKGWNWKAPQKLHEQHHVSAAVKHAFPNGIVGDLNQSGHVTDREWKDYSRFLEAMKGPHKADVLQFLGRRPLHKATAPPAGHHPTPHGTKPRPSGRLDWMSNAEFALLSIANDRKHGISDRFDRDRLRYFQVAGIGGRPFKGDMGADMYGFHVQPGGGYARPAGTGEKVTAHRRPFDDFGTLAKGWNLVQNKTGAPEKVVRDLPVPHATGGTTISVSYKGGDVTVSTTGGDPKAIASEVHKVIAKDAQVIVKALERHEKTFA